MNGLADPAEESPAHSDNPPLPLFGPLSWLLTRIRRVLGFGVMHASAPLRNRNGEPIRARAWLESARIEERYQYVQEISLNADVNVEGEPSGLIKLILPYDGEKFFTQQAYQDVVSARRGGAAPVDEAIVGFLTLTGHERTGLDEPLGLNANFGCVPIRVHLPPASDLTETDRPFTDANACVISQLYNPEFPDIVPVHVDIELDDPDTAESSSAAQPIHPGADGVADVAARREARVEVIDKTPERQLDFEPEMWLRITVRLHLPRRQTGQVEAKVSKVFMSWPTHTSLRSLELLTDGNAELRYNPEQEHEGRRGGLEWSGVPMTPKDDELEFGLGETEDATYSEDEIVTFTSEEMKLSVSKPGELYKEARLVGWVEVTVNRLLSGMNARLYGSTGKKYRSGQSRLKMKSVIRTNFALPLYDAFARRTMSPYQWLYFDEVIPSRMRIDDITMALKNRGFRVSVPSGADPEDCRIRAERTHGPDQLQLTLYVKGARYKARRERSVPGGMTYRTAVDSGELRIFVYGSLRAESTPVVHEINALRRALRERFDRLPAGR